MSDQHLGNTGEEVHPSHPLSLFSAILLGVIGAAVFIVQPGFVQGLVKYYHFSEQSAGYVASVEMWGIALTTLVIAVVVNRFSWRVILAVSIALMACGNFFSIFTDTPAVFASWRFVAGIGSGGLISLTFTIIGLTANPDRNFGYLIMAVLTFGALGLWVMPLALSIVGIPGVLLFFTLFTLLGLPFVRYLPTSGDTHAQVETDAVDLPLWQRGMAVTAMFLYFTGQGVVWVYLFLIGVEGGASEQQVANGLTLSQFLGIAGAFAAVLITIRFGRLTPITFGILGGIIPLFFLIGEMGALVYGVAVSVYNFAWNMTHPFLLAALASFDRKGTVVTHGVAAQMLGLAVGPAIAAYFISPGQFASVNGLGIGFFALALFFIAVPVLEHRRRIRSGIELSS
ncbi:major facilitator superfamily protein [Luminiphilus syltensis NOR5-1B]|uniref:Major facilitator superfamily protein n=1 Tax=Luminiphilus syltensis NOR5-1B TaxID=565045 RepID=B8KQR4_9GAMM|nr:MFS transporter [Luminiphilus syltensis]EED34661.1 major facilitator superfamily protein [Luminiphilus syltensis NOR5-1B]